MRNRAMTPSERTPDAPVADLLRECRTACEDARGPATSAVV